MVGVGGSVPYGAFENIRSGGFFLLLFFS